MSGHRKRQQDRPESGSPRGETRRRDRDAFADLYARFAHRVHAYALQRVHDPELAADITSTTFVRALNALPDFDTAGSSDPGRAFEGWVLAIARNVIIDHVRADQRLTILDAGTYRDRLVDHAQDPAAIATDDRDQLLDALSHLNDTQQRIVLLRLQGWNGVEIAELLGISHGAVRVAQHRAYGRLRDLLSTETDLFPVTLPETRHV